MRPRSGFGGFELLLVGGVVGLGCIVVALLIGRDLNWDYFNYHDYASLFYLQDRLERDFFAAGYQGYLNPLPFYLLGLMLSLDAHSVLIASVISLVQSLNLFFLYLVCKEVSGERKKIGAVMALILVVLGSMSSVFIGQLGSTFVDPLTTPLVMAALWLVVSRTNLKAVGFACFLAGAATALKLTNAVFAVGLFLSAIFASQELSARSVIKYAFCCGVCGVAGFLMLYFFWGWALWSEFGSPVFPVFNNIFKSDFFSHQAIEYHRFVPQSFLDFLFFPFDVVKFESWVYAEIIAPDFRPLMVFLLFVLFLILLAWRCFLAVFLRFNKWPVTRESMAGSEFRFWLFFLVSLILWQATSGNGRYATPVFLLLGLAFYMLARRVLPTRYVSLSVVTLCVLQVMAVISAGNPRWNSMQWSGTWLSADVSKELSSDPVLMVSVGPSSESYVVRHLHPESSFTNPIGLLSIKNDGAGWDRFLSLKERFSDKIYVIFKMHDSSEKIESVPLALVDRYDFLVDRLGLRLLSGDCGVMHFNDMPPSDLFFNKWLRKPYVRNLGYCKAVGVESSSALAERRELARVIMDAYEEKCPDIFSPRSPPVEGGSDLWVRLYGKYDMTLGINMRSGDIYYFLERQAVDSVIGNIATWAGDVEMFACRLPFEGRRDISTLEPDAYN